MSRRPVFGLLSALPHTPPCCQPSAIHWEPFCSQRQLPSQKTLLCVWNTGKHRRKDRERCVHTAASMCVYGLASWARLKIFQVFLYEKLLHLSTILTPPFSRAQSTASGWSFSLLFSFRESFSGFVDSLREAFCAAWINKRRRSRALS